MNDTDLKMPDAVMKTTKVMCGCGDPEAAWRFVRDELQRVSSFDEGHDRTPKDNSDAWMFGAYVIDNLGLTEHGGSVFGGWLTDDGKAVLAFLNEYGTDWMEKFTFVDSEGRSHGQPQKGDAP